MGMKEGVCSGAGGVGAKREGVCPDIGHSVSEAMRMDTCGQVGAEGLGKHSLREGNHNKGGGKVDLRSGAHPKKAANLRRK